MGGSQNINSTNAKACIQRERENHLQISQGRYQTRIEIWTDGDIEIPKPLDYSYIFKVFMGQAKQNRVQFMDKIVHMSVLLN